jgi:hypothetical protein
MPREIIQTEETLIIETPERVPLEFALASIGNRFLAVAIDLPHRMVRFEPRRLWLQ